LAKNHRQRDLNPNDRAFTTVNENRVRIAGVPAEMSSIFVGWIRRLVCTCSGAAFFSRPAASLDTRRVESSWRFWGIGVCVLLGLRPRSTRDVSNPLGVSGELGCVCFSACGLARHETCRILRFSCKIPSLRNSKDW
jgi:hypothetical protein